MDKKTKKLQEIYGISEEILSTHETSIEINVLGRRSDIISMVQKCDLSFEDSDEEEMSGKECLSVFGNISSILAFLNFLEQTYGPYCMIGVIAVAAVGTVVYMSIPEARKKLFEQMKSKE